MLYIHVTVYKINCFNFFHARYVEDKEIWRECKQTLFSQNGFRSLTREKGDNSYHPLGGNVLELNHGSKRIGGLAWEGDTSLAHLSQYIYID